MNCVTLCNTHIVRWLRSVCIHCANCGEQIMRDRDETGAECNTMVPIVSHRADQCTTLCNMCTGCTNCAANCDIVHWLCNLYIELQIVQIVPIKWERDVMGAVSDAFEASTNANGRPRCTLNNIHYNAAYSVQCSPMCCIWWYEHCIIASASGVLLQWLVNRAKTHFLVRSG